MASIYLYVRAIVKATVSDMESLADLEKRAEELAAKYNPVRENKGFEFTDGGAEVLEVCHDWPDIN